MWGWVLEQRRHPVSEPRERYPRRARQPAASKTVELLGLLQMALGEVCPREQDRPLQKGLWIKSRVPRLCRRLVAWGWEITMWTLRLPQPHQQGGVVPGCASNERGRCCASRGGSRPIRGANASGDRTRGLGEVGGGESSCIDRRVGRRQVRTRERGESVVRDQAGRSRR